MTTTLAPNRIPARELYLLRNAIPIDRLIQALPALAAKKSEGVFRFLCPLCSGFQTATNPKTNLARCFRCNKNFNTIDLVMQVQNLDFKAAVAALSAFLQRRSKIHSHARTSQLPTTTSSDSPDSIRQILESVFGKVSSEIPSS
jgi:hypothetical protein